MKKLFFLFSFAAALAVYSCGSGEEKHDSDSSGERKEAGHSEASDDHDDDDHNKNPDYDPQRGQGKFTHVDIPARLDPAMAAAGEKVYNVKCSGCHKLTDEKLVGPGWKGVTARHKPEWIMNFVTNTDEMIDKDPKLQSQLEICMVRMPNQNLADDAARSIYEYMRKNDGVK